MAPQLNYDSGRTKPVSVSPRATCHMLDGPHGLVTLLLLQIIRHEQAVLCAHGLASQIQGQDVGADH